MPVDAEFEEKEYEFPLYHQLAQGSPNVWPPGQVFEGYLGVDAALMVTTAEIWRKLGYPAPLDGARLNDMRWGYIWKDRGAQRQLPTFKLNLFIQAKRPQRMLRRSRVMVQNGIASPCYRFEIRAQQQKALERLHGKLRNRGLVVYACPVFSNLNRLYDCIQNGKLIDYSTFPKAIRLNGHKSWTFDKPGASGLCCSEPEKVEDKGLKESINQICDELNPVGEDRNSINNPLSELVASIPEVVENTERSMIIKKYFRLIDSLFDEVNHPRSDLSRDYTKMSFFCLVYDLNWFVLGADPGSAK